MDPSDIDEVIARVRADFLQAYQAALARVNGIAAVENALRNGISATVRGPVAAISIGKAAAAMMRGVQVALGDRLLRGLVITKYGHLTDVDLDAARIVCMESAHPVADESALRAGQALLGFVDELPAKLPLIVLMSGGASALVDVLAGGRGAEDLARLNTWLLAAGLNIGQMNRIRKRISTIKGGRLAMRLGDRRVVLLLISDVPGDDPKVVGSGLLVEHEAADLDVSDLQLPDWLAQMTDAAPALAPAAYFDNISVYLVARPADAREAAADCLRSMGYAVHAHEELLEGDAEVQGGLLPQLGDREPGVVQILGSETTVRLPESPGRGGRCQSLALAAARTIQGRTAVVLAAGTDGTDGPGEDAGALVDGNSLRRAGVSTDQAADSLARADAGTLLEQCGDLIYTGPTGTNVMDLLLVWAARTDPHSPLSTR